MARASWTNPPDRRTVARGAPALLFAALLIFTPPALAQDAAPPHCEAGTDLFGTLPASQRLAIEAAAAAVPNGEGRLFRIERDGVPASYLFGTMHLTDPRVHALPPAAETAFAAARQMVVETLDIADEALMAGALFSRPDLTLLPGGTTLLDLLPAERREDISARMAERDVPVESVATLQPWFVTVALTIPPCEAARQAAGEAVLDLTLLQRAEADGKELHGLETAIEQMEAIADIPLDFQSRNLVATVDLLDRIPDVFETMIALYLSGRIAAIMPAIEELAPIGEEGEEAAAIYAAFEERVVDRRNAVMAERLEPILAEGDAFVAVGALHLPGEAGLVEHFAREGWRVTRAD